MEVLLNVLKDMLDKHNLDIVKLVHGDEEELQKLKDTETWLKKKEELKSKQEKKPVEATKVEPAIEEDTSTWKLGDDPELPLEDRVLGWNSEIPQRYCFYCFKEGDKNVKHGKYYYHTSCAEKLMANPLKRELLVLILDEYYDREYWTQNYLDYVDECISDEIVKAYNVAIKEGWLHIHVITENRAIEIKMSYYDVLRAENINTSIELGVMVSFNKLISSL